MKNKKTLHKITETIKSTCIMALFASLIYTTGRAIYDEPAWYSSDHSFFLNSTQSTYFYSLIINTVYILGSKDNQSLLSRIFTLPELNPCVDLLRGHQKKVNIETIEKKININP